MKVIAKITDDRFLVEATRGELANIMGVNYAADLKSNNDIIVGREVLVSQLWQALTVTRGRQKEVAELAERLRNLAARVDSVNKVLAAPIIEVKPAQ